LNTAPPTDPTSVHDTLVLRELRSMPIRAGERGSLDPLSIALRIDKGGIGRREVIFALERLKQRGEVEPAFSPLGWSAVR
jgi:hypothetical protein